MCRRKRSRPSSKRRLTKNVKRLSSGRSVCASAIGVVDEHRLRTNGPALATGASACLASAPVRAEEKFALVTEGPVSKRRGLQSSPHSVARLSSAAYTYGAPGAPLYVHRGDGGVSRSQKRPAPTRRRA